jgi:hypothetical protein
MRPVSPRLVGVDERTSEDADGRCKSITIGIGTSVDDKPVCITRWRLSDEDRARVFGGEDIFLYIFDARMPEMQIHVGSEYHELEA